MEKKGWKIIAIIFIILFVAETSFVLYGVSLVKQQEEDTNYCIKNVCGYDYYTGNWTEEFYDYYYDKEKQTCYCFDENNEVAKIEELV